MLNTTHPRSNLNIVLLIAAAVAVFLGAYTLSRVLAAPQARTVSLEHAEPGGTAIVSPAYPLHDFTLTSQTGEPVSLSDFRGKAVLLFFGYTHCPDICPGTLAEYTRARAELGADAENTAFVFVSIDPKRDTPNVIGSYLNQFDASFVGLTGDEDALRRLGAEYGLVFEANTIRIAQEDEHTHEHDHDAHMSAGDHEQAHEHAEDVDSDNYFVNHTSPVFLIDPEGNLRLVFFAGTRGTVMAQNAQSILKEFAS